MRNFLISILLGIFVTISPAFAKDCPTLLATLARPATNEDQALTLFEAWVNTEYSGEQTAGVEIANISREVMAYYIELTEPLPQTTEHGGYQYFMITGAKVFGCK